MSGLGSPGLEPVAQIGRALGLLDAAGDVDLDWFNAPIARTATSLHSESGVTDLFLAVAALGQAATDPTLPGVRRFPLAGSGVDILVQRVGTRLAVGAGVRHTGTTPTLTVSADVWLLAWTPTPPNDQFEGDDLEFRPSVRGEFDVRPTGAAVSRIRVALEAATTIDGGGIHDGDITIELLLTPSSGGADVAMRWQLGPTIANPVQQLVPLAITSVLGLLRLLLPASSSAANNVLRNLLRLLGEADLAGAPAGRRLPAPDYVALVTAAPGELQRWLGSLFGAATDHGEDTLEVVAGLLTGDDGTHITGATGNTGIPGVTQGWTAIWTPSGLPVGLGFGLVAARSDIAGVPTLRLGVRAKAGKDDIVLSPAPTDVKFDLVVLAECLIAAIPLTGDPAVRIDGATRIIGQLVDEDGQIVNVVKDGTTVQIGGFEAGLKLAPGSGAEPALALLGVVAPSPIGNYPRFDLLDLDNAAKLGAAAGAAGLLLALSAAGVDLGALAAIGQKVGAVLGLLTPTGAPAGYPVVDGATILQDPARAWKEWIAKLLVLNGSTRHLTTWLALVHGTLGDLIGSAPPALTGAGTVASPYVLVIHAGAPRIALVVRLPAAPAGRLALEIDLTGTLDDRTLSSAVELDSSVVVGVLAAELPAPVGGAGASALTWMPSIALVGSVAPHGSPRFTVSTGAPASLTADVDAVDLRFGWNREAGVRPDLVARKVAVRSGATSLLAVDELSLRGLIEGAGGADLPAALAMATAVGLAAVSPEAADRALAIPRLLGLIAGTSTFPAVGRARFDALLADPGVELPRLLKDRFAEAAWTSGPLRNDGVALLSQLVHGGAADPARRPVVDGAGTRARPWSVPLPAIGGGLALDLLAFLGPDGPEDAPAGWVDAILPVSPPDLFAALHGAAAWDDDVAGALLGVDASSLTGALRGIGGALGVGATPADVVTAVRSRLSTLRTATAARPTPVRVGLGVRLRHSATTGGIRVDTRLDVTLATFATTGAADVDAAVSARLEATLVRPGGWLFGAHDAEDRLRSLRLVLTWSEAAGFDFDLRLYDARVRGLGADVLALDDSRAGAAIQALREANPLLFVAAGAAGAVAGILVALGVADETAGVITLLAGPISDYSLANPAQLSQQLRDRFFDPATGAPRMAALGGVLQRLGATQTGGVWTFGLGTVVGHALALDILADATLRLRAGAADTMVDATISVSPVARTLAIGAGVHPSAQGSQIADLRFSMVTAAGFASPVTTLRLLPLAEPGPTLLGTGLSLVPPQADLGMKLLEVAGMVAAGLFVRFVVEDRLLPLLPADVFGVLTTLGLTKTEGTAKRVGDVAGLIGDPAAFFTAPAKLDAIATTHSFGTSGFQIALTHTNPPGDGRALSLELRTPADVRLGNLGLGLNAGLVVDLPEAAGRPRGIRPVVTGRATAFFGASGPAIGVQGGVDGSTPSFAILATPSGGGAPLTISLLPWNGIGSVVLDAAATQLLPLGIEELVKKLRTGSASADAVGDAIASLMLALGCGAEVAGVLDVDGSAILRFLHDPETAWSGLYAPAAAGRAARVAGLQAFVSGILTQAGVPTGSTPGVITLGSGLALKIGLDATRLGLWLEVVGANFPVAEFKLTGTKVGVHLATSDGAPVADVTLAASSAINLGAIAGTSNLRLIVGATGSGTSAGALKLKTTLNVAEGVSGDGLEILKVDILPAFALSVGGGVAGLDSAEAILGEVVLPAVLTVLCGPLETVLNTNIANIGGTLKIGELLEGAGLVNLSGADWIVRPRASRPDSVVIAAIGAGAAAAKKITGLPIRPVLSPHLGLGLSVSGDAVTLLDRPEVSLLRGFAGAPATQDAVRLYVATGSSPYDFHPGLVLDGFGVRVAGNNGAPLLDTPFGLGAVELRMQLRLVKDEPIRAGAELTVTGLNFPFGSPTGSNNPVAGSLFEERSPSPSFGVRAGYRHGNLEGPADTGAFGIGLIGDPDEDGYIWVNVGAQMGPLEIQRFGVKLVEQGAVGIQGDKLSLAFDARFSVGPLTVEAWGLGVSLTFNDPIDFSFDLQGLAAMYSSAGVVVAGAFLKTGDDPPGYIGAAVVRVPSFELEAVGAYTVLDNGDPSFFIFARANVPLGGPPFFFVTGLAGGFGFNRSILLPKTLDEVQNGPFMTLLAGGSSLITGLETLAPKFPAKAGAYWLAAGVNFLSFVLVKGSALVYVLIDDGFTLGVVGRAALKLPTDDNPILSLVLALDAGFSTTNDDARLWVTALLTSESFLIHPDVQITGGFALYIWFQRGDFVLSIGGYCNAFRKPEHYPDVPRVGFRWQLGSAITVKGGGYFALTPREAMGGCEFSVTGEWGPAKAWFNASLDMIIGWDPFYYYFRASIEIGGSIDLWFCEPEFSLGAEIEISGPEFGGKARVEILGIGVTIHFGNRDAPPRDPVPLHLWTQKAFQSPDNLSLKKLFSFEVLEGQIGSKERANQDEDDGMRAVTLESKLALRTKLPATAGMWTLDDAGSSVRSIIAAPAVGAGGALVPATRTSLDLVPSMEADIFSLLTLAFTTAVSDATGAEEAHEGSFFEPRLKYRTSRQPVALYAGKTVGTDFVGDPDEAEASIPLIDTLELALTPEVVVTGKLENLSSTLVDDEGGAFRLPLTVKVKGRTAPWTKLHATWDERDIKAERVLDLGVKRAAERLRTGVTADTKVRTSTYGLVLDAETTKVVTKKAVKRVALAVKSPTPKVKALYRGATAYAEPATTRTQTTVSSRSIERTSPPALEARGSLLAGFELVKAGSRTARSSVATRTGRVGGEKALAGVSTALATGAARLRAGETLIVEVPRRIKGALKLSGEQAVRVVMLDAARAPISDQDVAAGTQKVTVPAEVCAVVLQGLGVLPATARKSKRSAAPSLLGTHARGGVAAVGFDADYPLVPVGVGAWLARGAVVTVLGGNRLEVAARAQPAARVLGRATSVRVSLPAVSGTLVVTAVPGEGRAPGLEVRVAGRTVSGTDLTDPGGALARIVTHGSADRTIDIEVHGGSTLTGVFVVPGTVEEWAGRLATMRHWNLVEDGPPNPRGDTTIQLENAR